MTHPVLITTDTATGDVKQIINFKKKKAKPKTFGVSKGQYFYVVLDKEIRTGRIIDVRPGKNVYNPCRVNFRDMKTGKQRWAVAYISELKVTKKAAVKELKRKLSNAIRSHEKSIRMEARETSKLKNALRKANRLKV
jgi:hypothetical protein